MSKEVLDKQVNYQGRVPEYQQRGNLHRGFRYQSYEKDSFNNHQNFLYKRALFGLSMYEPEELKIMHWDKKRRIHKVNKHAQNILNIWKQQIINQITNDILGSLFGNSRLVKDIVGKCGNYTDSRYINTLDFKSLGISKKDIVDKLIVEGVLPVDFYQLKPLRKNDKEDNQSKQETPRPKDYRVFKFKQRGSDVCVSAEQTDLRQVQESH